MCRAHRAAWIWTKVFTIAPEQVDQDTTLRLSYAPNVTGSIKESGNGVANAWVNIRNADNSAWFGAQTDSNGNFALS